MAPRIAVTCPFSRPATLNPTAEWISPLYDVIPFPSFLDVSSPPPSFGTLLPLEVSWSELQRKNWAESLVDSLEGTWVLATGVQIMASKNGLTFGRLPGRGSVQMLDAHHWQAKNVKR